jgi:hypothetical protein
VRKDACLEPRCVTETLKAIRGGDEHVILRRCGANWRYGDSGQENEGRENWSTHSGSIPLRISPALNNR